MTQAKVEARKERAAIFSVLSNSFLVVGKIIIGIFTGSAGILAEAVHSGMDLVAAAIAWWSVRKAAKPPDEEHTYGHGKIENLSAFFESLLIVAAAVLIIWEGIQKFSHPTVINEISWGLGIMAFSAILNIGVSRHLFKVGRETDSQALIADAHHLAADIWSSLGVLVGLVLIYLTGWQWIDPVIAIGVGLWILRIGLKLSISGIEDLIDSALPIEEEELLIEILKTDPRIQTFHRLRSRKSGSHRLVDLHIHLDSDISLREAHQITHEIKDKMRKVLPKMDIMIHTEPCD